MIVNHADGLFPDLAEYSHHINDFCIEQFVFAKKISLLVNALPYINVTLLKSSSTLQTMIKDLLSGERSYKQIWTALLTCAPKMFWKKMLGK